MIRSLTVNIVEKASKREAYNEYDVEYQFHDAPIPPVGAKVTVWTTRDKDGESPRGYAESHEALVEL